LIGALDRWPLRRRRRSPYPPAQGHSGKAGALHLPAPADADAETAPAMVAYLAPVFHDVLP
jgi:hypothetical protein